MISPRFLTACSSDHRCKRTTARRVSWQRLKFPVVTSALLAFLAGAAQVYATQAVHNADGDGINPTNKSEAKVGVSTQSGAATLALPIAAAPGPLGMTPQLSLNYSSGLAGSPRGDGLAVLLASGWVFSLGYPAEITINPKDSTRFTYKGENLVAINNTGSVREFKAQFQPFAEIKWDTGADEWKVRLTDGTVLGYGEKPQTAVGGMIPVPARSVSSADQETYAWHLSSISRYGNTIYLDYEQGSPGGVGTGYPVVLRRIWYNVSPNPISIWFYYEPRPDVMYTAIYGGVTFFDMRLREVRTVAGDAPTRDWIRKYELCYADEPCSPSHIGFSGASKLVSVAESAKDGTELSPYLFEYHDDDRAQATEVYGWSQVDADPKFPAKESLAHDYDWPPDNGVVFSNVPGRGHGGYPGIAAYFMNGETNTRIVDLDGDGLPDVWWAVRALFGGSGSKILRTFSQAYLFDRGWGVVSPDDFRLETDAWTESGGFNADPYKRSTFAPSVSCGFDVIGDMTTDCESVAHNANSNGSVIEKHPPHSYSTDLGTQLMDVNGDGRPDLVKAYREYISDRNASVGNGTIVRQVRLNNCVDGKTPATDTCGWDPAPTLEECENPNRPQTDLRYCLPPDIYNTFVIRTADYHLWAGQIHQSSYGGAVYCDFDGNGLVDILYSAPVKLGTASSYPESTPTTLVYLNHWNARFEFSDEYTEHLAALGGHLAVWVGLRQWKDGPEYEGFLLPIAHCVDLNNDGVGDLVFAYDLNVVDGNGYPTKFQTIYGAYTNLKPNPSDPKLGWAEYGLPPLDAPFPIAQLTSLQRLQSGWQGVQTKSMGAHFVDVNSDNYLDLVWNECDITQGTEYELSPGVSGYRCTNYSETGNTNARTKIYVNNGRGGFDEHPPDRVSFPYWTSIGAIETLEPPDHIFEIWRTDAGVQFVDVNGGTEEDMVVANTWDDNFTWCHCSPSPSCSCPAGTGPNGQTWWDRTSTRHTYISVLEESGSLSAPGYMSRVTLPTGGQVEFQYDTVSRVDLGDAALCTFDDEKQLFADAGLANDPALEDNVRVGSKQYVVTRMTRWDPLISGTEQNRRARAVTAYRYGDFRKDFRDPQLQGFVYVAEDQLDENDSKISTRETCYGTSRWLKGAVLSQRSVEKGLTSETRYTYHLGPYTGRAVNDPLSELNFGNSTANLVSRWTYDGNSDGVIDPVREMIYLQRAAVETTRRTGEDGADRYTRKLTVFLNGDQQGGPLSGDVAMAIDQGVIADSTPWKGVTDTAADDNLTIFTRHKNFQSEFFLGLSEVSYTTKTSDPSTLFGFTRNQYQLTPISNAGNLPVLKATYALKSFQNFNWTTDAVNDPAASQNLIKQVEYSYTSWGGLTGKVEAKGAGTRDASGNLVPAVTTRYAYAVSGSGDRACNNGRVAPCETVEAAGTAAEQRSTTQLNLRYGGRGRTVDPAGRVAKYAYDGLGRLIDVQDSDASGALKVVQTVDWTNAAKGKNLSSGNPNKVVVTLLSDQFPAQVSTSFLNGFGEVVQKVSVNGDPEAPIGVYSGLSIIDGLKNQEKSYLPFFQGGVGFVPEAALPAGTVFSDRVYEAGLLQSVTAPFDAERSGPESRARLKTLYGAAVQQISNSQGVATNFAMRPDGTVSERVDDAGGAARRTTFVRDVLGRLTQVVDHGGKATLYGYDARDNPSGESRPDWEFLGAASDSRPYVAYQLRRLYDDGDQLLLEEWGAPGQGPWIRRTYDPVGRLTHVCSGVGQAASSCSDVTPTTVLKVRTWYDTSPSTRNCATESFTWGKRVREVSYDEAGRTVARIDYCYNAQGLISKTIADNDGTTQEMEFSYDTLGQLKTLKAGGRTIEYRYDSQGRLNEVAGQAAIRVKGGDVIVQDVDYDAQGRVVYVSRDNDATTTYRYDSRFLREINHQLPGERIFTVEYPGYSEGGNLLQLKRTLNNGVASASFQYNNLAQLTTVTDVGYYGKNYSYEYESPTGFLKRKVEGNKTTEFKPDPAFAGRINQLRVTDNGIAGPWRTLCANINARDCIAYDARGNLTKDGQSPWRHEYGWHNQLIRSTDLGNGNTLSWGYDAQGHKIRQKLANASGQVLRDKRYFYHEGQGILETYTGGSKLYVFGLGMRLAEIAQDGTLRFYHEDHQGSTVAVTSPGTERAN